MIGARATGLIQMKMLERAKYHAVLFVFAAISALSAGVVSAATAEEERYALNAIRTVDIPTPSGVRLKSVRGAWETEEAGTIAFLLRMHWTYGGSLATGDEEESLFAESVHGLSYEPTAVDIQAEGAQIWILVAGRETATGRIVVDRMRLTQPQVVRRFEGMSNELIWAIDTPSFDRSIRILDAVPSSQSVIRELYAPIRTTQTRVFYAWTFAEDLVDPSNSQYILTQHAGSAAPIQIATSSLDVAGRFSIRNELRDASGVLTGYTLNANDLEQAAVSGGPMVLRVADSDADGFIDDYGEY